MLDDGRIVESGAHAQLLGQNGLYARLYVTQFGRTPGAEPTQAQEVTRAVRV